jgi:hypothetical protein
MCNITVGRYPVPTDEERAEIEALEPGCAWPSDTWQGWIEPDDKSWLVFVAVDGAPKVYLNRTETGAVIEPAAA